jgi:CobQ-like glutamine amidotransferase family enzyme
MNIYGDRGNIMCLRYRCAARGIALEVEEVEAGDRLDPGRFDLIFIGGAQDSEQRRVADDLRARAAALQEAANAGVVVLAVCGGYQLFGRYYRSADGKELPGAGVLDLHTVHPGPRARRFIGNVAVRLEGGETLVGFENHGGRTYLGPGVRPLGEVLSGFGNNGEDGTEGAVYKNVYGTYLHGALLPKNPRFADHLIAAAARRKHSDYELPALDDRIESAAHAAALQLALRSSGR